MDGELILSHEDGKLILRPKELVPITSLRKKSRRARAKRRFNLKKSMKLSKQTSLVKSQGSNTRSRDKMKKPKMDINVTVG